MRSAAQRVAQLSLRGSSARSSLSSPSIPSSSSSSSFSGLSLLSSSHKPSLSLSLAALGFACTSAVAVHLHTDPSSSSSSSSFSSSSSPSSILPSLFPSSLFPSLHADAPPSSKKGDDAATTVGMGTTFTKPSSSVDLGSLDDDDSSDDESKPAKRKGRRRLKKVRKRKKAKAVKRVAPCKYDELDMAAKTTLMDFAHLVFGAGLTLQTNPLVDPMNPEMAGKQSKHLELATTMDMNMQEPTQLSATVVVGEQQSTVLHGSMDMDLSVKGRLIKKGMLLENADMEMHFSLATKPQQAMFNSFVLATAYKGSDWHWTATAVNGLDTVSTSYTQAVTPYTSLGLDLTHKWGKLTKLSCAGRYKQMEEDHTGHVWATFLSDRECSLSYTRHASPSLSFATDIKYVPVSGDLVSRTGLHLKHRTFSFQGMVDTQGTQMATLESRLMPTVSLSLNGIVSHAQARSMWGVNVVMML